MSILYTLVVTTIMSTSTASGLIMYDQLVEKTPNLTQTQCEAKKTATFNNAVEKKLNVVVKCVPQ